MAGDGFVLDSYAAKTCVYALHLDRTEEPGEELPANEVDAERMAGGVEFERSVGELLVRLAPPSFLAVLDVDRGRDLDRAGWQTDRESRLDATLQAMSEGVPMIWNPRLPPDPDTHRSGEPDLLLCTEIGPNGGRYVPLDVKAHHTLEPDARELETLRLETLFLSPTRMVPLATGRLLHFEDLLQLAHYWRMLEDLGRAPDQTPVGGIIGSAVLLGEEPALTWFDLGEWIDLYDERFAEAFAVVERAVAISKGSALEPIARPWYTEDCHKCGWRAICGPRMLERRDVSLIKPHSAIWAELDELEIEDFATLAELTPATERPDGRAVGDSANWLRAIRRAQMAMAGDILPLALDPTVVGEAPARPRLWRRDRSEGVPWELPRADVEVDLDMESTHRHVYLWGTLLSYRPLTDPLDGFAPGYRGFGDEFLVPDPVAEGSAFTAMWQFIDDLRAACRVEGRSLRIFCYAGPAAEERWLRHCALTSSEPSKPKGLVESVEELIASPSWVDLLPEVRARVESLNGFGLKIVARALGFSWRADDAGGDASMLWYERATGSADSAERLAWQARILEYNEDDVRATHHLREWFDHRGPEDLPRLNTS